MIDELRDLFGREIDLVEKSGLRNPFRRREILSEAPNKVSAEFRSSHPEIPWRKVIDQRNVLVHEYGEIKHELLWRVA